MKVILVTPYYHQPRGNTVTAARISGGLNQLGISTEIVSITDEDSFPALPDGDLVHGFNAFHFYKYWRKKGSKSLSYIITITGTDLNYYLDDEQTKDQVIQCLYDAKAVHVFDTKAKAILLAKLPDIKDKTFLIPQGIHPYPTTGDLDKNQDRSALVKEEGNFLFVLPAGIRKVKNITSAIQMLMKLREQVNGLRLWLVGPIIEEDEGNAILELVDQHSQWIRYLGQFPHDQMGEILRRADVILNTSLSEGQSSAILESMSEGIPILASNIEGNREIVRHGTVGYLYQTEEEFVHYARQLIEKAELRERMGHAGKEYVMKHHSIEKEIQSLSNIYRNMMDDERM